VEEEPKEEPPADNREAKQGIFKDEEEDRVNYKVIFDYFGYAEKIFGGRCSFLLIIVLHILINVSTSSLSFYLAYALSSIGDSEITGPPENLAGILVLIVAVCLIVTIIGKVISTLIFMQINRNLHSACIEGLVNTKM
jgi:hypothetical protein